MVGVISDTHGLLRPEAIKALQGSEMIIHAGDVGKPEILTELKKIAPTFAVRGNVDGGAWVKNLPLTEAVEVGEHHFYVIHIIEKLDLDPIGRFSVVIYGHSHRQLIETINGVIYLNPGSAGPCRFDLPASVARVKVDGQKIIPEIVPLKV